MGQWGQTYNVFGAQYLVHLDTGAVFAPARPDSAIDTFVLVNSSGNTERDKQIHYHLHKMFVGRPLYELEEWYIEYQNTEHPPKTSTSSPWALGG